MSTEREPTSKPRFGDLTLEEQMKVTIYLAAQPPLGLDQWERQPEVVDARLRAILGIADRVEVITGEVAVDIGSIEMDVPAVEAEQPHPSQKTA